MAEDPKPRERIQISHFSTSSLLSNKKLFPSFFRTVPSDTFQSKGLAQLVLHFNWTWVGLVAAGEDYGRQGIQIIKEELIRAGACVALIEYISINQWDKIPYVAKVIKESTAGVVVAFTTDVEMLLLVDEMERQNVRGKIIVASEAWSTSALMSLEKYSSLLIGTIGFSFLSSSLPKLEKFLRSIHLLTGSGHIWIKTFWEEIFTCKILDQDRLDMLMDNSSKSCTGNEDPEFSSNLFYDVTKLRGSYNLYLAIYVLANAMHRIQIVSSERVHDGNQIKLNTFNPWQLSYYIKNVRLKLDNGREMFFDKNGDPPAQYDIVNWQLDPNGKLSQVKIGYYDTTCEEGRRLLINRSVLM
ncbi:extracellular calcium-sensing receptor-like [Anomaloglossus baeobatrachus]